MTQTPDTTDVPIAALFGASVEVSNTARLARVLAIVCLVALAVTSVVLFVTGARKNHQIDELHHLGVPVSVRVESCLGLLGGSGSQAVGYSCQGSFTLDGRHHEDQLPGTADLTYHSLVKAVVVPGDPGLIALARTLPSEHTSNGVYLLPAVLLVLAVIGGAVVIWEYRRRRVTGDGAQRGRSPPRA